MKAKWNEFANRLPDKDKRALTILVIFLAPILVYFALLKPSLAYYLDGRQAYSSNRELLDWVNLNARHVETRPKMASEEPDRPLLELVTATAEQRKLPITRLQPEADTRVRVWMSDVDFTSLVNWLYVLTQQSGAVISSISIDRTPQPGQVNVQCLIQDS